MSKAGKANLNLFFIYILVMLVIIGAALLMRSFRPDIVKRSREEAGIKLDTNNLSFASAVGIFRG